jgi:hypothetical protein
MKRFSQIISLVLILYPQIILAAERGRSGCPLNKATPESIFVSNVMFYTGAALILAICVAALKFALSILLPKKAKVCPVSALRRAKKIVIPQKAAKDIAVSPDRKEFTDILSNLTDEKKLPNEEAATVTLQIHADGVYTIEVSMAGWNFAGEERNSRRLANNMQLMAAVETLLSDQSK